MLQTKRLVIRPYSGGDLADMLPLLTDARIKQTFMLPDFPSPAEAEALFEKLLRYSRSDAHYERGVYRDGRLIGFFNDVAIDGDRIELGYVLHPDFWNQGYMTEALAAVISDLFRRGFDTVEAAAFADNLASRRVMEKCGMTRTEKTEEILYQGRLQPCVSYSIQKTHPKRQKKGPETMNHLNRFYEAVRQEQTATLATAADGRVTMRAVSPVLYDNAVLIFTGAGSTKYRQLLLNPRCCLAVGGFYIEARATFCGATMQPKNEALRNAYAEKFPGAFDEGLAFGGRNAEFLLLHPARLSGWAFPDGAQKTGIPTIPFEVQL